MNSAGDLVVDAHMANEGDGWSGSGANPWHLDATTDSVLFLTNESNQPARVGAREFRQFFPSRHGI